MANRRRRRACDLAARPITERPTSSILKGVARRAHSWEGIRLRPSYFGEIYNDAGALRGRYETLRGVYQGLGEEELARRILLAAQRLRELGATFPVDDGTGDLERLLPVDWVPRIVAAEEGAERRRLLRGHQAGRYGDDA
jgi:hypothetical protein